MYYAARIEDQTKAVAMTELSILFLFLVGVVGIAWGFKKRSHLYQVPFLMSLMLLLYILPGLIGSVAEGLPEEAIIKTTVMTLLCVIAFWIGYGYGLRPFPHTRVLKGNTTRILIVGIMLSALSGWAYVQLGLMTTGTIEGFFTSEGAYGQLMEGPLVAHKALSNFGQVGLMLCLVAALRKPSRFAIATVLLSLIIPLAVSVLLGRRFETLTLIFTIALVFMYEWRYLIPRWIVASAIPLTLVMIVIAPDYRKHSQIGGDHSEIAKINVVDQVTRFILDGAVEIRNGIYIIGATDQVMTFQWGGAYYNGVIRNIVPKFIVGQELKEGLMIEADSRNKTTWSVYNWERAFYSFPYGPAVAFEQFWWFGCIVFLVISAIIGWLWKYAIYGSIWCQVMYVSLAPKSLVVLLTEQTDFIVGSIYSVVMLWPLLLWITYKNTSVSN